MLNNECMVRRQDAKLPIFILAASRRLISMLVFHYRI